MRVEEMSYNEDRLSNSSKVRRQTLYYDEVSKRYYEVEVHVDFEKGTITTDLLPCTKRYAISKNYSNS
jgi:hypothetical protein